MKRAIVVLLPVLLLAGCSAPSADDAYLSTVRESIPAFEDAPDDELIELGKGICDLFDDYGFDAGFDEFVSESGESSDSAGAVAGAAVGAYCPEYADEF